jgi:hypothetical protein
MTYRETYVDGQKYATLVDEKVYILQRGNGYQASTTPRKGWRVVEVLHPQPSPGPEPTA